VSKDSSSIHFGSVHALFILPSLAMSSTINRVNEKSRTYKIKLIRQYVQVFQVQGL
jgi:hypothetical protein